MMREYIVRETDCGLATKQELVGELVRCKYCKYRDTIDCGMQDYDNDDDGRLYIKYDGTEDNGYCYWGERKDV